MRNLIVMALFAVLLAGCGGATTGPLQTTPTSVGSALNSPVPTSASGPAETGASGATGSTAPSGVATTEAGTSTTPASGAAAAAGDPTQAVNSFFSQLMSDPTGAGLNALMSTNLQSQLTGGTPVPAILGIESVPTSFSVGQPTVSGNSATVNVTLSYASGPVVKTFKLVQEGGTWKIDGVSPSGTQ